MDQQEFQREARAISLAVYARDLADLSRQEFWTVMAYVIMAELAPHWRQTESRQRGQRRAHYFSPEFLIGRSLLNNLINMGDAEMVADFVASYGYELSELESE